MPYLWVGLGGIVGSLLRFGVGVVTVELNQVWPSYVGTVVVNLVGSFLLGWLTTFVVLPNRIPKLWATLIGTGLIGSFTTFSTLSVDLLKLLQQHHYIGSIVYVCVSSIGGLLTAALGFHSGKVRQRVKETMSK